MAVMIFNAGAALLEVGKAALKGEQIVASALEADERLNFCRNKCPLKLWDEAGNSGFGKCLHKKCGCTKLKQKFKPLQCPEGFWK